MENTLMTYPLLFSRTASRIIRVIFKRIDSNSVRTLACRQSTVPDDCSPIRFRVIRYDYDHDS